MCYLCARMVFAPWHYKLLNGTTRFCFHNNPVTKTFLVHKTDSFKKILNLQKHPLSCYILPCGLPAARENWSTISRPSSPMSFFASSVLPPAAAFFSQLVSSANWAVRDGVSEITSHVKPPYLASLLLLSNIPTQLRSSISQQLCS